MYWIHVVLKNSPLILRRKSQWFLKDICIIHMWISYWCRQFENITTGVISLRTSINPVWSDALLWTTKFELPSEFIDTCSWNFLMHCDSKTATRILIMQCIIIFSSAGNPMSWLLQYFHFPLKVMDICAKNLLIYLDS